MEVHTQGLEYRLLEVLALLELMVQYKNESKVLNKLVQEEQPLDKELVLLKAYLNHDLKLSDNPF